MLNKEEKKVCYVIYKLAENFVATDSPKYINQLCSFVKSLKNEYFDIYSFFYYSELKIFNFSFFDFFVLENEDDYIVLGCEHES